MNNESEGNGELLGAFCTKEHFVEIVLIFADFYLIVNREEQGKYNEICDKLASELSPIFKVPLYPHTSFAMFRQEHQDLCSNIPQKFRQKLMNMWNRPFSDAFQVLEAHQRFEDICDDIETRRNADRLVELLLPILSPGRVS